MSAIADDVELAPREAVEFYLPILKEYSEKLDGICQKAHDILQSTSAYGRGSVVVSLPQVARLLDWFECLSPWIEKLIRRTATLLDHGQLGEEMELLLVLRTEELESHFRATPLLLDGLAKLFSPKDLKSVLESTRTKSLLP